MQPTTTGPRSGGSRFFASPPRTCRVSHSRQTSRPANRVAARKTAPGIFLRTTPKTRPENLPQLTETHQENSVFVCTIALGCVVAPNNPPKPKDDCVGLKDSKTGEITPVYDGQGGGVAFPQNADVAANVKTAQENSPWWKDTYHSGQWFASMVGYGMPWDYKTQGAQYESFGNFHYGYVGKAAGFSDMRLLTEAGRAQIANDQAHNRPVYPGDPGNRLTLWGAVAPYGDEPKDQVMIQQGMSAYNGNKELVHIPCGKKQ